MHIYDISLNISTDLPTWPGDPEIVLIRLADMKNGDACNVTQMSASVHIGTHVDSPAHFIDGDVVTVDQLLLSSLIGKAYVLHLADEVDLISADVIKQAPIPPRTRRLLFKTRNSTLWEKNEKQFQEGFVALSADAAKYLVDLKIGLVGVDYLSVAPYNDSITTHEILLRAGIILLEGLDLSHVSQGRYTLYCLPLKIKGCDGAPARAILVGA